MTLNEIKNKIQAAILEDTIEMSTSENLQRRYSAGQRVGACKWVLSLLDKLEI